MADDEHRLHRFVTQHPWYSSAVASLRECAAGLARMASVFPRFVGCHYDATTADFAIGPIDETRICLAHPMLGPRLWESLGALAWLTDSDA